MNPETNQLYIFKTDIGQLCSNCQVHKVLDAHPEVKQWSIDPDDTDCVLRISSSTLSPQRVISIINSFGHSCIEL